MDKEHAEILEKLDAILGHLKGRKPEVDEKLAKMLMCSCGPEEAHVDDKECDCECCKSESKE